MSVPLLVSAAFAASPRDGAQEFTQSIRPVLAENCGACHTPGKANNRVDFLKAETAKDIETRRGLWRSVAAQLRNRIGLTPVNGDVRVAFQRQGRQLSAEVRVAPIESSGRTKSAGHAG